MAADDPGTRPTGPRDVPTGTTHDADRDFDDVEEYVEDVDRDRPEAHLGDQVDARADEHRETLRGDEG